MITRLPIKNSRAPLILDSADAKNLPVNKLGLDPNGYPYMELKKVDVRADGLRITWRARVLVHHWLVPCHSGLVVDHINRNIMDARRSNLRLVSRSHNQQNSGPRMGAIYKGVRRDARYPNSYTITLGGSAQHYNGRFNSPEVAARVYDREAQKVYGPNCYLNFPDEDNSEYREPKGSSLKRIPRSGCPGVYFNHLIGKWYVQVNRRTVASGLSKKAAIAFRKRFP